MIRQLERFSFFEVVTSAGAPNPRAAADRGSTDQAVFSYESRTPYPVSTSCG